MGFHEDTFTVGSDTTLASRTPDVGTGYQILHQDGSGPTFLVNAANDDLRGTTGNNSGVIYKITTTPPSANYIIAFTLKNVVGFTDRPLYAGGRQTDVENQGGVRFTNVASGCRIYEKVSGTWSALGSAFTCPAAGSAVEIEFDGTTLKVRDDGVEVASATISLASAGFAWLGLGGGSELVTSTDDANSSWQIDDLVITDLGGGGSDTELVVADAAHAHTSETPALTQAYVLIVADAGHASGAENVLLTQAYLLAVDDATHAHTSETPALTQAYVLAIADATHSHTAEAPALVQAYTLAAQDAEHAHESENVTLSLAALLEVADASHAHTAENVDLVQAHLLAVADVNHSHTAETPALLQAHTLTVAGAEHLHAAENVTLASGVLLEVADVTHLHAAESPALIQAQLLAVAEVAHAHAAETLALAQAYTLTVAGAAHGHQADNVVLSGGTPYQPAPASRRVLVYRADRRADVVTVEARTIRIPPDDRGSDG